MKILITLCISAGYVFYVTRMLTLCRLNSDIYCDFVYAKEMDLRIQRLKYVNYIYNKLIFVCTIKEYSTHKKKYINTY